MKMRVAIAADRAASAFKALYGKSWGVYPAAERRALFVELAAALAGVNGAVAAQLPDDPEASDEVTYARIGRKNRTDNATGGAQSGKPVQSGSEG